MSHSSGDKKSRLDQIIPAPTLLKMLAASGYDCNMTHPAAFKNFSYLDFTARLAEYFAPSTGNALAEDVLRCIPADWKPNMARDYGKLGPILAEYIDDLRAPSSAMNAPTIPPLVVEVLEQLCYKPGEDRGFEHIDYCRWCHYAKGHEHGAECVMRLLASTDGGGA